MIFVALLVVLLIFFIKYRKNPGEVPPEKLSWLPGSFIAILAVVLSFQVGMVGTFSSSVLPALGFSILVLGISVFWLALFRRQILKPEIFIWFFVNLALPVAFLTRASGMIQTIDFLVYLLSQSVLLTYLLWPNTRYNLGSMAAGLVQVAIGWIRQFWTTNNLIIKIKSRPDPLSSKIKTIGLVALFLLFFTLLLSASDPVFGQIVGQIRFQLLERLAWGLLITIFLSGFLTQIIRSTLPPAYSVKLISKKDVLYILVGLIVLFFFFLVVQYRYLFAGSTQLLGQLGLTYSQYVRRGFIELLLTILAGGGLIYLSGNRIRSAEHPTYDKYLKLVASIGVLELFLMLVSALKRNMLYVEAYGLTRIRILGEFLSAGLAVMLLVLLIYVLWRKFRQGLVFLIGSITIVALVLVLNVANVDNYIFTQAPRHHDYTDYFYLSLLSPDLGSVQYQQMLTQISLDLDQLLAKSELTEKEKYQLAGIKLALISLWEKRNNLLSLTAPSQYVETNSYRLGYEFKSTAIDESDPIDTRPTDNRWAESGRWSDSLSYDKVVFASSSAQPTELPDWLVKERIWQNWSWPRARLSAWMQQNPDIVFDTLETQLRRLRLTQIEKQWDLSEAENKILYELKYPFMSAQLRTYYHPESFQLSSVNIDDPTLVYMEQNQPLFRALQKNQCQFSDLKQTNAYGRLSQSNFDLTGIPTLVLSFFSQPDLPSIQVVAPTNNAINTLGWQTGQFSTIESGQFVKLDLQLISVKSESSNNCSPLYQIKGWQVLKLLY